MSAIGDSVGTRAVTGNGGALWTAGDQRDSCACSCSSTQGIRLQQVKLLIIAGSVELRNLRTQQGPPHVVRQAAAGQRACTRREVRMDDVTMCPVWTGQWSDNMQQVGGGQGWHPAQAGRD